MLRRARPVFSRRVAPLASTICSTSGAPRCIAPVSATFVAPYAATSSAFRAYHGPISSTSALRVRARGSSGAGGNSGSSTVTSWSSSQSTVESYGSTDSGNTADSMTPQIRAHLSRVYGLIAAGVGVAAAGSSLMVFTQLGRTVPYFVPMIGGFIPLFWLMWAPPKTVEARLALFFSFTFLEGMSLAPLIKATMMKGVLGSSLVLTGCIFIGFSAAAYLSPRASLLKWQGPLYGLLLGMVAISLLNMFWPTAFAHSIVLYGGLALFSMFIATDTQAMIERARCGGSDHVQDALQMFLNLVNIFVRIAQIMRGE